MYLNKVLFLYMFDIVYVMELHLQQPHTMASKEIIYNYNKIKQTNKNVIFYNNFPAHGLPFQTNEFYRQNFYMIVL